MPRIEANGIGIHYEQTGSGEPLILIMGLGADNSKWQDHIDAYKNHFHCIAIDNRGAGKSDKPPGPYTTTMMADDVSAVMDHLHVKSARIAGISMGSCIAQCLALDRPDLVRSLVLVSSWAKGNSYLISLLDSFRKVRKAVSPEDFVEVLQLWIYTSGYFNTYVDDLKQGQRDAVEDDYPMPQHAFAGQCEACMTHNTLDKLNGITAPVLLTVGDEDIFTPLPLSLEMNDRIPNSELLRFPGCGHVHHWENLERFNKTTTEFLLSH